MNRSSRFPKRYADWAARVRVPAGFVLALAYLVLSDPTPASATLGVPIALAGIGLRAWAAGHLLKNQALAVTGPYAHVRNPLYLGTLVAASGLAIAARSWVFALLCATSFLLIYLPVTELEEQHLRSLFPDYVTYAQSVPKWWPRWTPFARGRFRWELYWRNREYQAAAAFLIALAILAWKLQH